MSEQDNTALHARLAEAESIIDALRTGEVDAVVGEKQVLLLRLRQVEEALRRSEARYRGIVEDQSDLVYRWDRQGRLTFVNQAFCRFFQQPCEALVGTPVGLGMPGDADMPDFQSQLASLGSDQPYLDQEHRVKRSTGEVHWLHITHRLIMDDDGEPAEVQSVARDITARKQAEKQLHKTNAELEQRVERRTRQLRALVRELDEAEQRERRRLAQFLHDDLQQLLVASKFSLELTRQGTLSDAQQQALDQAHDRIERSIAASRSLALQLNPPSLRESGLGGAMNWLADQMQELYQLPVQVDADPQVEPTIGDVRDLLFMCARELLLNVVKHAKATQAGVNIRCPHAGQVKLTVHDNGVGFDTTDWSPAKQRDASFGLWSIDERLQLLGGKLHVDSAPGQGCRVTLVAPASADEVGARPVRGAD